MMNKDYIVATVNKALIEEFELEPSQMTPKAHIRDDLHLDSLDIVDMILVLEQAFNFKLEDRSQIQNITILQDIYDFVESLQNSGAISKL